MDFATQLETTLANASKNANNGIYLSVHGYALDLEEPVRINSILCEKEDSFVMIYTRGEDDFGFDIKTNRIINYTCERTPDAVSVVILCDDGMEIALDFLE